MATSWHSNKFLNPAKRDGVVLPILHLNGYKIASPTDAGPHPARVSWKVAASVGYGYAPHFVEGR